MTEFPRIDTSKYTVTETGQVIKDEVIPTENGIQIHDMRKNPNDLPNCDESKQITFYVEEWIERIQKYHKHYCLGFYKKSFMNDDVKLFVEKSKGYEKEHLPKAVLFWYENPTI
ncbi:MAG: hypothetical protein K6F15_04170 [Treponema sp.]|nr:hypothetical protein [Treponema sp.]